MSENALLNLIQWKTEPYQKQKEAYIKLYHPNNFIYALLQEPGTGKSKTIIDIISTLFLEDKVIDFVFLIAPNGVHAQWANTEIEKHSKAIASCFVWNGLNTKKETNALINFLKDKDPNVLKYFCVNIETFQTSTHIKLFRRIIKSFKTFLILDEASYIKNYESNRTKALVYDINDSKKDGVHILDIIPNSKYRAILTGNIASESPFNVYSPFEFLKYNYFGLTYHGFRAQYGIEKREQIPGRKAYLRSITKEEIKSVLTYLKYNKSPAEISQIMGITESSILFIKNNPNITVPYKNLDKLKAAIDPVSFCCTLKECVDIKDPIRKITYIQMSKDQERVYKEAERDLITTYGDMTLTVANSLGLIIRLSQITSGFFPSDGYFDEDEEFITDKKLIPIGKIQKLEALKEQLYEYTFDSPILIFCQFVADIENVYQSLKKEFKGANIKTLYGATPTNEREKIRTNFVDGNIDCMLVNYRVGGTGFNFQRSHKTIFYSHTPSFEKRKQAEGRTYRAGQHEQVLFNDYLCKGTIDEKIQKLTTVTKRGLSDYFNMSIKDFLLGGI